MMMRKCFTTVLFTSLALVACQGSCAEEENPLVGVWQADVQPDKEKIDRVLKEDGMVRPLRLLVAPSLSRQLKATVIDLEFRSDGTCHIDDLHLPEESTATADAAPPSRTWRMVSFEGNQVQVQVTTSDASGKPKTKLWGAMNGAEADWHDAPFATPKFVRIRTATRSAGSRR